jgi:hypothetical protein
MNFAITSSGKLYTWGTFPCGLNLDPGESTLDTPTHNGKLEAYAFKRIHLTSDSAVAIGKSVALQFEVPDKDES